MFWIIAIVVGIIVLAVIFTNESNSQKMLQDNNKNRIDDYISTLEDVRLDKSHFSKDNLNGIGIDYINKKLIIFDSDDDKQLSHSVYKFDDVVESEIVEDGLSITKTSRASQFTGLAVGSLIGGGTGAIIGGLSGNKTNEDEVKSIDLKLLINDHNSPIHTINYFKPYYRKTQPKNSKEYKDASKVINEWHGIMKLIIENK